jgi:hypothetical protein
MTEDEAKTKWCPFARIADGEPSVAVNRPEPYGDVPHCLASFCMAWRWALVSQSAQVNRPDGYCGLAGEP